MDHLNIIMFDPNRRTQRPAAKSSCTHSGVVDYSADSSICSCENVDLYEAASLRRSRARGPGRSYLVHLILRAGLATSAHEARHMFVSGEICYTEKGRDLQFRESGLWKHGSTMDNQFRVWTEGGSSGDLTLDDDAQIVLRSECVECCTKPKKSEELRAATNRDTDAISNLELITEILVRRGLAASPDQAVAMVRAGRVVARERDHTQEGPSPLRPTVVTDPKKRYRFNEPIAIVGETAKFGSGKRARISRREFKRRAAYRAPTLKLASTPEDDL
jgi:hypothetical protein